MHKYKPLLCVRPSLLLAIVLLYPFAALAGSEGVLLRRKVKTTAKGGALIRLLAGVDKNHPRLINARQRLRGLRDVAKVSGMWPNLKFNYQREQLFPAVGQDTVGLQVTIPLAGRTFRQRDVAKEFFALQEAYTGWLSFQIRLQYLRRLYRWQRLRQEIRLSQGLLAVFRRLRQVLLVRVRGGSVAALEELRFDLEVEQQAHKIKQSQEQAQADVRWLARRAGVNEAELRVVRMISHARIVEHLHKVGLSDAHPYLRYIRARLVVAQTRLKLAKAKAWPDLSLSLAYLHQQAASPGQLDGHGFLVGVSLPLPLFQRNQVGIRRAQASVQLIRTTIQQAKRKLRRRTRYARQRLKQIRKRLLQFQKGILLRLPALLKASQVSFRGGSSLSTFLSTYNSIQQYERFGLRLQYELQTRRLDLGEAVGHVPNL